MNPKLLTNLIIFSAIIYTFSLLSLIFLTPYTGFDFTANEKGRMIVTRVDSEVREAGLLLNDTVIQIISAKGHIVEPEPQHYPITTSQSRKLHKTLVSQFAANKIMHKVLSDSPITVVTAKGKKILLSLDQWRPINSLNWEIWFCIILSLVCWVFPALVWAWRPLDHDITYITVSGMGLSLATISAITLYQIEMFYPPSALYWLVFEFVGIGNFIYVSCATCCFLYFPHRLPYAGVISKSLLAAVSLYTIIVLLDGWDTGKNLAEQVLYFEYREVYFIEGIVYLFVLSACLAQWYYNRRKPLERAESLWILFAAVLTPLLFFCLYLLPILIGQEEILTRTWNTFLLVIGSLLITMGVSRLRFFRFEKHIGVIYQWTFVSIGFIAVDAGLIYLTNFSIVGSTAFATTLLLFGYLPLRQWLYTRSSKASLLSYQGKFSQSSDSIISSSLRNDLEPSEVWTKILIDLFQPISTEVHSKREENRLSHRGQSLVVSANKYSKGIILNYANNGARLFDTEDINLVNSLNKLFITLFDHKDSIAKAQLVERERIRRDLHDQIGGKLLSMLYNAEDKKSQELASDTMSQLREILKAIKQEPVAVEILIAELRHICEESCHSLNLILSWQDNISDDQRTIPSFSYLNILSIFRELVNNTAKHAKAVNIVISVTAKPEGLSFSYEDDGLGFNFSEVTKGSGLFNISNRVEEIEGKLSWSTLEGTCATFNLPIEPSSVHE